MRKWYLEDDETNLNMLCDKWMLFKDRDKEPMKLAPVGKSSAFIFGCILRQNCFILSR